MSDADVHTLTGAHGLGALPPEELPAFEGHLQVCAACRQEVAELEATAARLAAASALEPPPGLRERVLAQVASVRQDRPRPEPTPVRPRARSVARRSGWRSPGPHPLGVAAAVLLAVTVALGGVVVDQQRRLGAVDATAATIGAIVADPDRSALTRPVAGGGSATLLTAGGRAVFLASDLRTLPPGRAYQLWVIRPGAVRSAGVLSPRDGAVTRVVEDVAASDTIGLSVEPAGGSEQPTTTPVLLARARPA